MNARDIGIIDIIFQSKNGLTMTEVVEKANLPQTTVHRALRKLVELRVMAKNKERYVLGPVVVRWMNSDHKQQRYVDLIHPFLVGLSREVEETVHLVQRVGRSAFYIDKVEGSGPIALKSKIGTELKLYQTGAGRSILMLFTDEELNRYFREEELIATTEHTIIDPACLRDEINKFREQGYSLEVEQNEKNIQCIGVSFRLGSVCLAISVTATMLESTEKLESFSRPLLDTVEKIKGEFKSYE